MKKFYFSAFLVFVAASSLDAQKTPAGKKLNWGIKTGINFSNLRLENSGNSDWKTGLAVGAFFRIKAGDKFQIQPEFLYSSMGGDLFNTNGTGTVRLNYFSIPVMAKYQWKRKFAFLAGPQIDMLIQAKRKNGTSGITKVTNNYNESSFNLTAGLEYWPWHCFGLSGRYIYGLSNVNAIGTTEMKNQGVQLMAAVKF